MSLAAALVLPSAPLLVPGVSARIPAETASVREAVDAALSSAPAHDARVLLAAAPPGEGGCVVSADRADLAGLSRPDVSTPLVADAALTAAVADAVALPMAGHGALPVDLAVLALHCAAIAAVPTVAIAAPWSDGTQALGLGAALVAALPADRRVLLVAAGDLSAGLSDKAPRPGASGAADWNAEAVAAVRAGNAAAFAALGPDRALAAAARSWPALALLLGALHAAGVALTVHCADAPRGVGYVVASG